MHCLDVAVPPPHPAPPPLSLCLSSFPHPYLTRTAYFATCMLLSCSLGTSRSRRAKWETLQHVREEAEGRPGWRLPLKLLRHSLLLSLGETRSFGHPGKAWREFALVG